VRGLLAAVYGSQATRVASARQLSGVASSDDCASTGWAGGTVPVTARLLVRIVRATRSAPEGRAWTYDGNCQRFGVGRGSDSTSRRHHQCRYGSASRNSVAQPSRT
jgi:hypothetical protein